MSINDLVHFRDLDELKDFIEDCKVLGNFNINVKNEVSWTKYLNNKST
jgi:hypothetical protein